MEFLTESPIEIPGGFLKESLEGSPEATHRGNYCRNFWRELMLDAPDETLEKACQVNPQKKLLEESTERTLRRKFLNYFCGFPQNVHL